MFVTGPRTRGSIPGRVIKNTRKIVLDDSLLKIQLYNVRFKGAMEGKELRPPLQLDVVAIEKGAFESP